MQLERQDFVRLLGAYHELALVSEPEIRETLGLFDGAHPLHATLGAADSLHLHVRVDDTARLPRERILALGGKPETDGSVLASIPGRP